MLCKLNRSRSAYLILEISEIRVTVYLIFFLIFLKKFQKWVQVRLGIKELKFCKNALCYEGFKASFSDFKISEVCGGFSGKKIAYSLVFKMCKV
jgi:hypothetical protein